MAMTLRLNDAQTRALDLLARSQDCSKQDAVRKAIISAAARAVADTEVLDLARSYLPEIARIEKRIRQTR